MAFDPAFWRARQPRPLNLAEINEAIRDVASGAVTRIAKPGQWVVYHKEGEAKPRLQVFA